MADAKVLARLRKLLALSASSNPHESSSASRKASHLMEKHGLTEADVAQVGEDEIVELSLGGRGHRGFAQPWKFALVTVAARACSCEALGLRVGRRRKVRVVGKRRDAEEAVLLFEGMVGELRLLERPEMREVLAVFRRVDPGGALRLAARYLDAFRIGAVAGFRQSLRRAGSPPAGTAQQEDASVEGLVRARDRSVRDRLVSSGARMVEVGRSDDPEYDVADDLAYTSGFEQALRAPVRKKGGGGDA